MERFGELLTELRTAAGLSQRELAKRSGLAREHINQIESKKAKGVTLRTADKLAKGLGMSPMVFFDGQKELLLKHILIVIGDKAGKIDVGDHIVAVSPDSWTIFNAVNADGEIWLERNGTRIRLEQFHEHIPMKPPPEVSFTGQNF